MAGTDYDSNKQTLWGVSLVAAPALFALSTFLWVSVAGRVEYGAWGGALLAVGAVFWVSAFDGLFALVRRQMPRYAVWGWLIAVYGCIGGAAFGVEALLADAFSITHAARLQAWERLPGPFGATLFWPGPLFPLSLLVLGIVLVRARAVSPWLGVCIAAAGVVFPASRIPRIALLAHGADVLMFVPMAVIGLSYLQGGRQRGVAPAAPALEKHL